MDTFILVYLAGLTVFEFAGLGYCIWKIKNSNNKTGLDYSAPDIELARESGWFNGDA